MISANNKSRLFTARVWAVVMIIVAIGIGILKMPNTIDPDLPTTSDSYVCDYADLLSSSAEKELDSLNRTLIDSMGVVIGCVTTWDGPANIYKAALEQGDRMGLEDYDFLIMVDEKSQEYILVQGIGLVDLFTDADCDDYADTYLAPHLDSGDFDEGFLELAYALTDWYEAHYVD